MVDPFGDEPTNGVREQVNRRADELFAEGLYADQAEAQRAAWLEHAEQRDRERQTRRSD